MPRASALGTIHELKIKVALKYCGSCNPQVDLFKVSRRLDEVVARRSELAMVPLSTKDIDVVVILCGCPRACGNKGEVRARAKHYLLINDESLSDTIVLEASLLEAAKG